MASIRVVSSVRGAVGARYGERKGPVHEVQGVCRCRPDREDTEDRFGKHVKAIRFAHHLRSRLTVGQAQDTIVQNESPSLDFLVRKAGLLCLGLSNWCAREFGGVYVSKQQVHASNWHATHRDGVSADRGAPKEGAHRDAFIIGRQ
jgi:hypothetical protein